VASGTATVEAALIGNPFVVVYRVSPSRMPSPGVVVKVPHVAMANLIAGKRVVPELIQHDFTAANIVEQIQRSATRRPCSRVHDEGVGSHPRSLARASGYRREQ
jgi:lipid A disaccharide synthetase